MGALEDKNTALRVLGELKEEGDILPLSSLSTLSSHTALRGNVARLEDDTIKGQGDHSLAMETQKMISFREKSSIHDKIWWPHMHALIKPRRYWIDDSLPWETNFQKL